MAIVADFETFQAAVNRIHAVMLELQEANKDVLVGKRNLNCLSCGIKEGQSSVAPTAHSTIHGRDGRIYRGNHGIAAGLELESGQPVGPQRSNRVGSAHPSRANRRSDGMKEAYGNTSSSFLGQSAAI